MSAKTAPAQPRPTLAHILKAIRNRQSLALFAAILAMFALGGAFSDDMPGATWLAWISAALAVATWPFMVWALARDIAKEEARRPRRGRR